MGVMMNWQSDQNIPLDQMILVCNLKSLEFVFWDEVRHEMQELGEVLGLQSQNEAFICAGAIYKNYAELGFEGQISYWNIVFSQLYAESFWYNCANEDIYLKIRDGFEAALVTKEHFYLPRLNSECVDDKTLAYLERYVEDKQDSWVADTSPFFDHYHSLADLEEEQKIPNKGKAYKNVYLLQKTLSGGIYDRYDRVEISLGWEQVKGSQVINVFNPKYLLGNWVPMLINNIRKLEGEVKELKAKLGENLEDHV